MLKIKKSRQTNDLLSISPQDAFAIFEKSCDKCIIEIQEQFKILMLNIAHRVLGIYESGSGGSDGVIIDLRLLFTCDLKSNASCVILFHNHPSSNLKPSEADRKLTNKIVELGRLLNIRILDHLIINRQGYYPLLIKDYYSLSSLIRRV